MTTRRTFLRGASLGLAGWGLGARANAEAKGIWSGLDREMAEIERKSGGRLGVAVEEVRTGESGGWRTEERFPMCSTAKVLGVAGVLARADAGREQMDRVIRFEEKDLVTYSPITKERVGSSRGMTVAEVCAAAMMYSDNTAANLLLATLGGPAGLTSYARSIGDKVTRLDRTETSLNEAAEGDPRDTTSPAAMRDDLRTLVFGKALSAESRGRLTQWMIGNTTGADRLRAGLPKEWRVGDKTGSGERGTTNDVAVLWPTGSSPVIVTSYLTGALTANGEPRPAEERTAVLAEVGRAVAARVGTGLGRAGRGGRVR